MGEQGKKLKRRHQAEIITYLRRLAKCRNNDAVKLAYLEKDGLEQVGEMDLAGLAELKRNANGSFEVKFVDRVRVLTMLREMLDEQDGGALKEMLDSMGQTEDGDES